jgi:hypothetical protein
MAKVIVFTRYGKTPEDVTAGLRSEYKIVNVKPTGSSKSGLNEYHVAVTPRSPDDPGEQVIRAGRRAHEEREAYARKHGFRS